MERRSVYIYAVTAGLICLLVYLRALNCGFVNYDDPEYVLDNIAIRHFDTNFIIWAFTNSHAAFWMPLTWISLALDYKIWGFNPVGYHLTNIVLHAVNTGLVVLIADKLLRAEKSILSAERRVMREERQDSSKLNSHLSSVQTGYLYPLTLLLAGLLWGLHPLRVESVAWVTERKDVLNGLFALGALLSYLQYVSRREGARSVYLLAVCLFALSLMAKSVSVVLPLMFLVFDWYPLGRLNRITVVSVLKEKTPFIVLSILMTLGTIYSTDNASYLINKEMFPFSERLLVSGHAIVQYVRYMLFPGGITSYHSIPDPVPFGSFAVGTLVVFIFTLVCIYKASKIPRLASSWFLFVIPLLPVLAFLQSGGQEFASRYTYLPAVAPSIIVAALVGSTYERIAYSRPLCRLLVGVVGLTLASYMIFSYRLITIWDNTETLWSRAISCSQSSTAYWNRAAYYYDLGKYQASAQDITSALALITPVWRPYRYNLYAFRGLSLLSGGNLHEAVKDFSTAISLNPHPLYYYFRGVTFESMGRQQEADADFLRAGDVAGPLVMIYDQRVP